MKTTRLPLVMLKVFAGVMMLTFIAPLSSYAEATGTADKKTPEKQVEKRVEKTPEKPAPKNVKEVGEVMADQLYAPENCEMQIGFPKPPQIQRKCGIGPDGSDSGNCTEVVTYRMERTNPPLTQTDQDKKTASPAAIAPSSLSVRVTCQSYKPSQLESFNDDVLKSALDQMLKEQNYESYRDFTVDTTAGLRRASSISMGALNDVEHLYTGQIWKGAHSLFTLEAQMIGPSNLEIEKNFVAILRATHPKQKEQQRETSSKPDERHAQ